MKTETMKEFLECVFDELPHEDQGFIYRMAREFYALKCADELKLKKKNQKKNIKILTFDGKL